MANIPYATQKRTVEQYKHKGKQRASNPPAGMVDAENAAAEGRKAIKACYRTVPIPFQLGSHGREGVKIVVGQRIENLKIMEVV